MKNILHINMHKSESFFFPHYNTMLNILLYSLLYNTHSKYLKNTNYSYFLKTEISIN